MTAVQENKGNLTRMTNISPHSLRVADLPTRKPSRFSITPTAEQKAIIAEALGIVGIRKLTFQGELAPSGKRDWQLKAKLGATVVQSCVVTLEPVTTRIDSHLKRGFLAQFNAPSDSEVEMPEDDSVDELGEYIDPYEVMIEALSIELPDFPRKPDAELEEANFTEPGQSPMTDDDARPFAALAELKNKLGKSGEDT